ncbi:MAG: branched-chain amino acid ABC transporter permease [Clostridia bacterium]|nr:branched-chain amino acid ABC transporter permease [Clostridia bacterium]MBP3495872.1 branched-chain amino acid ABC transporter permease [Clostridia bacterium]
MKIVKKNLNYIIIGSVAFIMMILGIVGLPLSITELLEKIAIAIILAVSLNMVVGFLGELSLGHAGFMCIGAYMGGKLAALLSSSLGGTNILTVILALIVGGLCAGICGFIVGLPALRLRGDYLAIVTLAFGEIVKNIVENSDFFGGQTGLKSPQFIKNRFILFTIGFLVVLLTIFVIQNIIKSKHGRAITAIRDNEIAAKATGINVTKYKLMGFVVSAVFAGLAGALYSFTCSNIQAITFDYNYSIEILVIVVLGGMTVNGSIISATLITALNTILQTKLGGSFAVAKDLIYALILILVVIYKNAPALKDFREKYNLGNLWRKIFKHKNDPSTVRDDATRWDVVPTKISMDEVLSTEIIVDNTGDNSADIGERGGNK